MINILSVRYIGDGNYKFICYLEEKKYKFNFNVSPESCCPPFYRSEDLHINVNKNVLEIIPDFKNVVKTLLNDNMLNWMNNTHYDPHKV